MVEDLIGFEFGIHHGMIIFALAKIGEALAKIAIAAGEMEAEVEKGRA